jgi:sodium transport system permease protein
MKKEFARFFGDARMVVTALILPGLMIYVVYSFMGVAMKDMFMPSDDHTPVLNAVNFPQSIAKIAPQYGFEVNAVTDTDEIRTQIGNKETDILIVFPEKFDESVESYDTKLSSVKPPNIEIYYNSVNPDSSEAYGLAVSMLDEYEASLSNKFDINRDVVSDLATNEDVMAFSIASLLPFLLTMLMFTGCMSLAPESIAGEKERGTIATILVTPIKRSELAIGKMLSLGVLAFLCGLSSVIGTFVSLPKMMMLDESGIDMNIYGAVDYVLIALIVLSTILMIIAVISIISAFSKTIKEAGTSVTPLMIVVMVVGISSMFGGGAATEITYYLIPLYNSVQAMSGVFSFNYSMTNVLVAIISNVVYACAGGFILTRMFNSEKVIFSR